MDIDIRIGDYIFNCRAVGIIKDGNRILFQKKINDKYWALPGGKISVGETGEGAIIREIDEELGIKSKVYRVHSIIENFFFNGNDKYHQYIYCYLLEIEKDCYIFDKEEFMDIEGKNIIYKWFKINELDSSIIKPDYLSELLQEDCDNIKFITNNELDS